MGCWGAHLFAGIQTREEDADWGWGGGGMEGGQNVEENEKGLGGWRWGVHEEQEESAKQ